MSESQWGQKVTLVIRTLVCATFVAILGGAFAIPVQAQNDELTIYEQLFNEYKSAIIPMAYAIQYLDNTEKLSMV